jgi:hypothetical protein
MQSLPEVPTRLSEPPVPTMTFVPVGQQDASSASVAVTRCCAVDLFPAASVAVHVTMVRPSGSFAGASRVIVTAPPQSCAVAWPIAVFTHVLTVMYGGA